MGPPGIEVGAVNVEDAAGVGAEVGADVDVDVDPIGKTIGGGGFSLDALDALDVSEFELLVVLLLCACMCMCMFICI